MARNGKVQIRVGKGVLYKNLPKKAIEKIKEDLTFDNPTYTQAVRHGKYVSASIPPFLYFYRKDPKSDVYWTPRGYIWFIKKWLKENNYEVEMFDKTLLLPKMDIKFHGDLRDYQDTGVMDMIRRYPIGVLEAATGAGKTVMGTAIIGLRKQPTLIIVHNKELLYQWEGAIKKFLNYDTGMIGDGNNTIKDITIGIINSVRNKTDELGDRFGQIIVDECHRCPASTWTETLEKFSARFYLGLSATPFRKDGLGKAINFHIGPLIHKVNKKQLQDSGAVLKPQIILVKSSFSLPGGWADQEKIPYSTVIKKLTADRYRNSLICRTIYDDLRLYKQNILVVSDRVSHCKELARILQSHKIKSHILHGGVNKSERKNIVEDVKAGRCKILIATISLIGEGFDAPNLSSLHITTPIKFSGRLIQTVGRILRPEKNKVPRVYDYRDEDVKVLQYSGYARNRVYKEQWN